MSQDDYFIEENASIPINEEFQNLKATVKRLYDAADNGLKTFEEKVDLLSEIAQGRVPEVDSLKGIVAKLYSDILHLYKDSKDRFEELEKKIEVISPGSEDEIDLLLDTVRLLNLEIDPEKLQNLIIDIAIKITNAERGFLLLADNSVNDLTFRVARNMDSKVMNSPEFEVSRRIISEVIIRGKTLAVHNALSDKRFNIQQSVINLKLRSILAVPIRHESRILGIIYLDNRKTAGTFREEHQKILERLADQMAVAVIRAEEVDNLKKSRENLIFELKSRYRFDGITTVSEEMHKILKIVGQVASTDVSVLILGESGTGKELIAKALHHNSPRASGFFVFVNCAAIPEQLLESELFGYVRGAFTGAVQTRKGKIQSAHRGTLFLDEIGDMAPQLQGKLLRVLQEKVVDPLGSDISVPVDIRLLAATNKNLEELVKQGKFREDLYYRLNVISIKLPPLRERREDIPVLVEYFLAKFCSDQKKEKMTISKQALNALCQYEFPGNIRELENLIIRIVTLNDSGKEIDLDTLPEKIASFTKLETPALTLDIPDNAEGYKSMKERVIGDISKKLDKEFLIKILKKAGGKVTEASRLSGIDRRQIYRLMESSGFTSAEIRDIVKS